MYEIMRKFRLWRIKHKKAIWIGVLLFLLLNVGISFNLADAQGNISVTFDKLPMMLANKVVIREGEQTYETTDFSFVKEITNTTLCATHSGICHGNNDRWIEVYCGPVLVRKMRWEHNHNGILVYEPGPLHWIIGIQDTGIVYPSAELTAKLEALMEK